MVCVYHSADLDGHCAGAIVKMAMPDISLFGMNYGDSFPWDNVKHGGTVVMVDFSLPPEEMKSLGSKPIDFIWIDHHKTALADAESFGYSSLPGLREIGMSGCELSWRYFFPQIPMPTAVRLLGRYDVWDHVDPDVLPFQSGMIMVKYTLPDSRIWPVVFQDENELRGILDKGRTVLEYQAIQNEKYSLATSFETVINGLKVVACNAMLTNSKLFDAVYDPVKHDAVLTFGWRKGKWNCSLYTATPGVDVSITAKFFGGGGHAGAAGFSCDRLPFNLK